MPIAMVVTPFSDSNLKLASQIGVTDIVGRHPAHIGEKSVASMRKRVEAHGMRLSVIEGYLPIRDIILARPGRASQLSQMKSLLREMARNGITTLSYHWMPLGDAIRTSFMAPERGGAFTSAFDADQMASAPAQDLPDISGEELWANLRWFLERILPVAEKAGVNLALHPDDPPLPVVCGRPCIMNNPAAYERLVSLVKSRRNGICFCQGTFAEMGVDIPKTIRRLGPHIRYVHFRDVIGSVPRFHESFHDNGKTDMAAAMRAYKAIGYDGVMRPDHVPLLEGETGPATGYTMMGRLFAVGYMRGLIHAVAGKKLATDKHR